MSTKKVCPKGVSHLPLWPEGEEGASHFHTPQLSGESVPRSPERGYGALVSKQRYPLQSILGIHTLMGLMIVTHSAWVGDEEADWGGTRRTEVPCYSDLPHIQGPVR